MKIGAVSMGWGNVPIQTIFEQLRQIGGECVEVNGRPGRHAGLILDESNSVQIAEWAAGADLEITAVSGYCDFAHTDQAALDREVERLLSSCRAAAAMEVGLVRAFVGDQKPDRSFADFRPQIVEAFQQAAEQADQLGIILAIENHGRLINEGLPLVQLVADIDAFNLGITLDSGNFCWAGHSPAEAELDFEAVLPYIVNVHIKDGIWRDDSLELVPAGEGDINLVGWIGRFVEQGYQGPIQSEYEGPADFLASTQQSIEYLKSVREQLLGD